MGWRKKILFWKKKGEKKEMKPFLVLIFFSLISCLSSSCKYYSFFKKKIKFILFFGLFLRININLILNLFPFDDICRWVRSIGSSRQHNNQMGSHAIQFWFKWCKFSLFLSWLCIFFLIFFIFVIEYFCFISFFLKNNFFLIFHSIKVNSWSIRIRK